MEWSVVSLKAFDSINGLTDVVGTVAWKITSSGKTYFGETVLNIPAPQQFTPFSQLTEVMLLGWVYDLVDKQAIEQKFSDEIQSIQNKPKPKRPPWQGTAPVIYPFEVNLN